MGCNDHSVLLCYLLGQGEFRSIAQILPPWRLSTVATVCPCENMYCAFLRYPNLYDIDPLKELFADFGIGWLCLCLHGVILIA